MSRGWNPTFRVSDENSRLYPPRTVLLSSNRSAISQRDWGFITVQGGVDPRNLGLLPRLMEALEMWNDLWAGDWTLYCPEVELTQHANHGLLERQPVGWGFVRGGIMCGWIPIAIVPG